MRQSQLFYKSLKKNPKDAESVSHNLLTRAGFIDQLMAGVYTYLPLGFKVLKNIEDIIRKNMEAVGGQEILMPSLTPKANWEKTNRWDNFDALFKINKDYALAPTHEEVVSPLAQKFILSYKDLPLYLFQIQTKFRNEPRAKSGILRTREFIMKDLYSFHTNEKDLENYYQKVAKAYLNIFKECGIRKEGKNKITYKTLASGGTFSRFSHEYQTVTESGEDIIYVCAKCGDAVNKEIKSESEVCPNCNKESEFRQEKAVEVGNIFKLGTKFSNPFGLNFRDKDGKEKPVIMGCYGLGLGRLMGAIVEANNDEKGMIWPEAVAPFYAHLIQIEDNDNVNRKAEELYANLVENGMEVLYDDRKEKAVGEKFAESDLIGIPYRIVISEKTLKKGSVEVKERKNNKIRLVKISKLSKSNNLE